MDTSDTRRELGRSARLLLDEERWLFLGLVVGGIGYLVWLAGTGVAVSRAAELVDSSYSVDPWSTGATALAVTFAVLWVLLPSLLAVRYVVGKLTNLRGNVEQCYRFDRPLVALVPPLVVLGAGVALGAVRGAVTWEVLAVLGLASTLLVVRTVAYGYRVYSFSTPRLLQALLFVCAVVATVAVVSLASPLTGHTVLVEATAARYGVAAIAFGTVSRAGVSAPTLPLVAVATPAVLALAYVWVQLFDSLVVRLRRPDIPRSEIRAGQRYPQVVQPGTSDRLAMGTASGGSSGSAESDSVDAQTSSGQSAGSATASTAEATADESADAPTESVGQTRVYTPPEDADDEPPDAVGATDGPAGTRASDEAVKNEFCSVCGETYEAGAGHSNCPNCNAVLDHE